MNRLLNPLTYSKSPNSAIPLLEAKGITKTFTQGGKNLEVLKGVSLKIYKGDALCIMGSSGAGKSTLLQILGTLDRPTSGSLFFDGKSLLDKSDEDLSTFRNKSMGFVFQFHHLMNEFTALENIMMPCQIAGMGQSETHLEEYCMAGEIAVRYNSRSCNSRFS